MKINWKSVPLLQLVMPFILGVTIYRFTHFYSDLLFVSSILCISALYLLLDYNSYRFRWFYTLFVHFFVVQFAIILCHFSLNENKANYFTNYANEESIYLIEIIDYVKQKENSIELLARIKSVDSIKTSAKILIYMQKQSDNPIDKGSLLITTSKPTQLQASPNPYQLNYKSYLNRKGINHQLFLNEEDYEIISNTKSDKWIDKINSFRNKLLNKLKKSALTKDQFSFASAILLGDRTDLSYQKKSLFSATGTMHFLAVSVLHVGITYFVLIFLLPIKRNTKLAILNLFILLICLWVYALLCGLSVSVVRAVLMLSFVSLAKYLNKNSNVINTVLLSAFILLLINPFNLFDVGFQLSYIAVIGIVLIYPKLHCLLNPKTFATKWLWQISCLSLSAQIATIGLSIYYFHQFPNYFLLSNILLFPPVPFILIAGILYFFSSFLPFLNELVFYGLQNAIQLFNTIVLKIEALPYAVSQHLFLEPIGLFVVYLMVIFLLFFLYSKKLVWSNLVLLLLFYFLFDSPNKNQIAFYSVDKHSAILFCQGNRGVLVGDSLLLKDKKKLSYNLGGHFSKLGLKKLTKLKLNDTVQSNYFWKDDFHFQFLNKKGLIVNSNFELLKSDSLIEVDYCLLSKNIDLNELYDSYAISLLLLDASLPYYTSKKLENQSKKMGLNFHNLKSEFLIEYF